MSVPNRRASHIGVLRPSQGNDGKPAARRQSLSVGFASRDNENLSVKPRQDNNNNINNNNNNTPAMSTPAAKAPSEQKRPASSSHHHHHHQRTNLGSASAYYFANQPKTPMEKAAKARKKLSTSLNQSINNNNSMNESSIMDDECFTLLDNSKTGNDYTGTLPSSAMESSYFSSSSDSNADGDLLNQSTLSDTTEMSAANYVLLNAARQRWSLGGAQPPTAKPPPEQMPPPTNRRKTLPPGLVVPPAANVTEKAYQVAADMKERRLSRQSLGSRFSLGSELAPSPEEPAEEQTADSLASLPTDTSSPPNNIAVNMENNSDPHNTSTASDDSVASLGSLFDDMLPQGNQRKSETASDLADFTLRPSLANDLFQAGAEKEEATDKSMESEGKSVSTQEAVGFSSQTSQLGTPVEASEDNVAHSPRPLPETVAFESAEAPASPAPSVEVASPHKAKSPRRSFSLTRKLSQSPVRMIDSPARNTRNSKQKRLSLSAEKKRKLSIELADDVSVAKRGRKSSLASTTLNSSFRKASSRQHGSARKVAFGSPDVVEFHVTSPSMSLTPMPKPSAKDRFGIPEDTQEIEADMNALLENMHNPDAVAKLSAGHTPYASRRDVLEESTRELEKNLDEVLNEAAEDSLENDTSGQPDDDDDDASDMSDDSQAGRLAGEHTRALEIGMDELLAQNADESQQAASGNQSVTANDVNVEEEDQTVELEADMGALLMAADAFPPDPEPLEIVMADDDTPVAGHRRSSIASRRFSLATKSRLSLDNTTEFLATRMEETSDDTPEKVAPEPEPVLEIKVEQVLTVASTNASLAVTMSDIFTKATEFLQKNPSSLVAETYGTFLKEICNHVASGQVPGVDPEYFGQLSEQEQARCIKLQECLRSDNKVVTEQSLGKLMDFATQEEKRALEKWLLDTANQVEDFLTGHIEDLSTERERVLQELKGIDDAECFLSTLKERAARKARRLSLQRRKTKTSALEEEIRKLEEEIEQIKGKVDNAKTKKKTLERASAVSKEQENLKSMQESTLASAENMGKNWTMLKALVPFETRELTQDRMTLVCVGPCPSASISIVFGMKGGSFSSCFAKIDPSVFPKNKPRNTEKYRKVLPLLQDRAQTVCDNLSAFAGSDNAGDFLRKAAWELRRATLTADEICKLQRRYMASFSSSQGDDGAEYQLLVEFQSSSTRVSAMFTIPESYPFSPMDVELDVVEGDDSIADVIQGQIEKTAKTGYGYLARVCDVIASTLP